MVNVSSFYKSLVDCDVDFFSGVPDSLLKSICAYIQDTSVPEKHIIAANEGNALSIGLGYHLATNKIPLVYMQNSGLGNVVNPLLSLADPDVYSVPLLMMIGWRGEPGVKDEPQHVKQGRVTLGLLDEMEVPYDIISSETTDAAAKLIIENATAYAKKNNAPYALLVKKGSFSSYALQDKGIEESDGLLLREEAIKVVLGSLNEKDIVVSTTGVASREVFEYRASLSKGHHRDFLTVGGMGHANQIALGIALQKPERQVYCLDGDGALLMHLGALPVNASMECGNLKHIVFNNGAHDSVGGQPTVAYGLNMAGVAQASGYKNVFRARTNSQIIDSLDRMKLSDDSAFLEIDVKKGFRKDLGRPTVTPAENKRKFMEFLK